MIEVGDALPDFAVEIRDSAGVLAAPGALTVTLTLPDLSTTPITPANPSTGRYTASYVTTQAGRHWARWVATGANASAHSQMWDVEAADPGGILSLADARQITNIEGSSQDDELRLYIAAVTQAIEDDIGPVGRRTVTETVYPAAGVLDLRTKPVLSVTSITPYAGAALSSTVYTLRPGGFVYPATYAAGFYAPEYAVVYVAGRAVVQAKVNLAAREVLRHLWSFQQGPAATVRAGFGAENLDVMSEAFSYVKSYGVQDLLKAEKLPPGVA